MESICLRIENWELCEVEEEICYSTSLKVPSTKDELLRLLPVHLSSLQYHWQCRTGLLSKAEHSFTLCVYREYHEPKIGIFFTIQKGTTEDPCKSSILEIRDIEVTYIVQDGSNLEGNMTRGDNPPKLSPPSSGGSEGDSSIPKSSENEFWYSTFGWPADTSEILLVFHVVKRKVPKIVSDEIPSSSSAFTRFHGFLDIKKYFLSPECSDVTIQCGGGTTNFPAHLMVLCNRSDYFDTMFSSEMKEAKDKVVSINDFSGNCVKELLRFIYTGEVNDPSKELFMASDKYGMDELRWLCERYLVESLKPENAMEMYDLGQMHRSEILSEKAKRVILWNKKKFAPDPETLKEFTCKYPQLVFELLNFET